MILIIFISFLCCLFLDSQIQPIIKTSIENEASKFINLAINSAIESVIKEEKTTYENLINITYDDNLSVQALSSNSVQMSKLKASINLKIEENLKKNTKVTVMIPIGTLTDSDMLRDIGPKIPFKFTILANSFCNISSDFMSVGLNQTKHTIYLNVSTKVEILTAKYTVNSDYETDFPLAETVIVGNVPQVYASSQDLSNLADSVQLLGN